MIILDYYRIFYYVAHYKSFTKAAEELSLTQLKLQLEEQTAQLAEQTAPDRFLLDIECSKGTYVRTLVEDLGAALGCPACLAALRRTRAGAFTLEGCVTLETIQAAKDAGRLETLLLGVDTVFRHLPAAQVSEKEAARLLNGAPARRADLAEGRWRLYVDGAFLGLGEAKEGLLRAEKLFVERA